MKLLRNIRFPVTASYDLEDEIGRKLSIPANQIEITEILRKAVDTRRKNHPIYDFTVALNISGVSHQDLLPMPEAEPETTSLTPLSDMHPFIIGMGPSALFCALSLVKQGFQPYLFDRGDDLDCRAEAVSSFWDKGHLDEQSNVQFGEGGAGAFSDGKLTSRGRDSITKQVFELLISFGAEPAIAYDALPHLGTDGIRMIVSRIRDHLISKGCQFFYRHQLQDITIRDGKLTRVRINDENFSPEILILALGNSARDTFKMLHDRGLAMEAKPFAVGVRIEQNQHTINKAIYGSEHWASILGPASYRLTHDGTYSFCMCPGGFVIASSSETGGVVTNGMSFASRDHHLCNSAIVTVVNGLDYGNKLMDGIAFQQKVERAAYRDGYFAPAQYVKDFFKEQVSGSKPVSSYKPNVYCGNVSTLLPFRISNSLKKALHKFTDLIDDFSRDAILIAPETRTSSPLRLLRDRQGFNSIGVDNIYPIGEGSGYAGGIVSSAADGFKLGQRFRLK